MNTSRLFISLAVAAFGATMFLFPAACNKPSDGAAQAAQSTAGQAAPPATPPAPPAGRLVEIKATNEGYSPSSIDAKVGETLTLRFTRTTKSECLKAVAIPDLKIEKDLPMDTPVDITIKPEKEGKLVFQCWMAMVKGAINVAGS